MIAAAERFGECVCRGCELQRVAGDVAQRIANLPHQDVSEMVILRYFDARAYLGETSAPLILVTVRPGGDPGRLFRRALFGDVAAQLQLLAVGEGESRLRLYLHLAGLESAS